jgi:hypothetical protein
MLRRRSYLVLSAVVFLIAGGVLFILAYARKMAALANPPSAISRQTYAVAANGSARAIGSPVRGFSPYLSGGTFLIWGAMLMLVGLMILAADIRWSYPRPSPRGLLHELLLFDRTERAFAARETQGVLVCSNHQEGPLPRLFAVRGSGSWGCTRRFMPSPDRFARS